MELHPHHLQWGWVRSLIPNTLAPWHWNGWYVLSFPQVQKNTKTQLYPKKSAPCKLFRRHQHIPTHSNICNTEAPWACIFYSRLLFLFLFWEDPPCWALNGNSKRHHRQQQCLHHTHAMSCIAAFIRHCHINLSTATCAGRGVVRPRRGAPRHDGKAPWGSSHHRDP